MPWGFLLLKDENSPFLLYGIYGTKETGRARPDDYQIIIFIGRSILAAGVAYAVLCMQIFILPALFEIII